MNSFPTLEIQQSWRERQLLPSVLIAVACCGTIFGALSLITIVYDYVLESIEETSPPLLVEHQTLNPKAPKLPSKPVPLNIISATNSPISLKYSPQVTQTIAPKSESISFPSVATTIDLQLDELEFENPFVKSKPTPKPIAKKSSTRKPSKPTANLAKKITKNASLISRSTPSYPRSARRKGLEGRVVVTITIGTSGKVSSSYISKSCGHPSLDNSALAAARKYRFSPAINGLGQGIPVKRAIPFNFQITG